MGMTGPLCHPSATRLTGSGILLLVALFVFMGPVSQARASETILIRADEALGDFPLVPSGFLHGVDEQALPLNDSLVAALRPQNWRLYKFVSYSEAVVHEPVITFSLSDHYAWEQGGFPNAHPWEDWDYYEQYITMIMRCIAYYFPNDLPTYYDIWNEPDHPYFWTGTYEQLLETFARAYAVIREVAPYAKIVGPSVARYRRGSGGVADVVTFLADLDEQCGIRLDAVSWHENESGILGSDRPEHIIQHTQHIRVDLATHFPPDYQPELHINEYGGGRVHLSPGYNIGYLYYLIEAEVNAAMRACWSVLSGEGPDYDYWCNCWNGLNGMLMQDGETPQVVYWIYRALVQMGDGQRLQTYSSSPSTCALVARNDESEELSILIGRYHHDGTDEVLVTIEDYPFAHPEVTVRVERIPHHPQFFYDPPHAIPMPEGPWLVWEGERNVTGGTIQFRLEDFPDNDAYLVSIGREPSGIVEQSDGALWLALSTAALSPEGHAAEIRFFLPTASDTQLDLFDPAGRRIRQLASGLHPSGEHRVVWDGRDAGGMPAPTGVYFVRLAADQERAVTRVLVIR